MPRTPTAVVARRSAPLLAALACPLTQADLVTGEDWSPSIGMSWWIDGSGEGDAVLTTEPLDEGLWRTTGLVGDAWRVVTWSILVDITSGSPVLEVQSLIAKNYTLLDAQFEVTFDLDLSDALDNPMHRLLGELQFILAGTDGAAWIPRDDMWLWSLRADGADAGGIFEQPWMLQVESGAVSAFGGLDLPSGVAPTDSMGVGLSLMLTAGEGASMSGMVAVPAPGGVAVGLVALLGLAQGRRRCTPTA
ncbi:MAG: hypothetical protein MK101_02395 [Phycisphaerales bacterium]|nr:hypothetical protein [Phycisphaerales bacterium]